MSRVNDPVSAGIILRSLPRAFDDLPIWAQLNITWKCNLDCAYCSEYDNSKGHIPYEDLVARIDKIKALGTLHTDLIGGEPLLHPDLLPLMRYVTHHHGMTTGMTTNGFLLTEDKLKELIDAGMGRIQMSVDGLNPKPGTPKSLKTLRKKIEMVAKYRDPKKHDPVWFRVNTVICDQTIDEVEQVANVCFDLGVPINFSVVHDHGRLVKTPNTARFLERVQWLKSQKEEGKAISTPFYLIEYYERALQDKHMDWTCQGGNKCFYVSAEGNFQYCYHVPSTRKLMDVTREEMAGNRGKKGCEENCGVDCVIHTSLPFSNRGEIVSREVRRRAARFLPVLRG
ncbi:MAG: Fe-S protein radical family [Myxococcales bacterium]|jgi:MoaA/NifB/PqqE/SkfB family radical SAM enzyme|nr:Fe-S protein radical family [Myxococcales bacterium]